MKRITALFLSVFCLFALCSCKQDKQNDTASGSRVTLAVSLAPQATFLQKICGDWADIITMIPAGASAESYEPSAKEISRFSSARMYFAIGVPAEENGILPNVSSQTEVVDLAAAVRKQYPDLTIGDERDPHIWLSVKRVQVMVQTMADKLCTLAPEKKEQFRENAQGYIRELQQTETKMKALFDSASSRSFFVFHPAFGYLADDFSLTMYALEKDGKEATAQNLAALVDLARQQNIHTVFCQAESSVRQAKAFADDIDGSVVTLEPIAADYTENMLHMAEEITKAMKS